MKLTKPQLAELRKLAIERQSTRGGHRARVQNSLRQKGLAQFCEEDGTRRELSVLQILISYGNPHPYCEITEAGRRELAGCEPEFDKASKPLREAARVWACERGLGFGGGWIPTRRLWSFSLYGMPFAVVIDEDGREARVTRGHEILARTATPRALRAALAKIYEKKE